MPKTLDQLEDEDKHPYFFLLHFCIFALYIYDLSPSFCFLLLLQDHCTFSQSMLPYLFLSQHIQLWFALYSEEGSRPVQLEFKTFDRLSTLNGTAYK